MANNLSLAYDPIFYAQEAISAVESAMGMAARMYRGFDEEKKSATPGTTVRVRKPSTFTVQDGGTGTTQDVNTDYMDIVVNKWKEVKFKLTDKELSLAPSFLISDHIRPAAYALAKYVNTQACLLANDIPWQVDLGATTSAQDIILPRSVIRQNTGDLLDREMLHYGIDDVLESNFLDTDIFKNASTTGQGNNQALFNGSLGIRYGVETFVDQTLPMHIGGTALAGADQVGALTAEALKDSTTVALGSFAGVETLAKGDSFVIAGNTQRYVITGDVTFTAGAATANVFPKLVQTYPAASVVTFDAATTNAKKYSTNLMFHKNAFALAFAPLSEVGDGLGARMATITDPKTNISIRSRIAYDDKYASVVVTLDILFGMKTVYDKYACIGRREVA